MATVLTDKVRNAIRRSTTSKALTEEIEDCIEACKKDLKAVGVINIDETDALIIRAVILYARADFNFNGKAEQYRECYKMQAMSLSLDSEYNTEKVTETDTESGA